MARKKKKVLVPSEEQEQALFVTWLTRMNIPHFAIPNGGYRNAIEAYRMKRTGTTPGIPDLCIPVPVGEKHGLWIEMKRKVGGIVSDSQKYWLDYLNKAGYDARLAHGFDQARCIASLYLGIPFP